MSMLNVQEAKDKGIIPTSALVVWFKSIDWWPSDEVYDDGRWIVTAGCTIRDGQPIHIEKTLESFCVRCVALLEDWKCWVSFEKRGNCSLLWLEWVVVKASRLLEKQKKVA